MTQLIPPPGYKISGRATDAVRLPSGEIIWGGFGNSPQGPWGYYTFRQPNDTTPATPLSFAAVAPGGQGRVQLGTDGVYVTLWRDGDPWHSFDRIVAFDGVPTSTDALTGVSTTVDQTARDMAANAAKSGLEAVQIANGVRSIAQRADERAVEALSQTSRAVGMIEAVSDQVRRLLGIVEAMPQFIADTAWAKANDAIVARFNAWASYQDRTLINLIYNRWRRHAKYYGLIGAYQDIQPDRYE